MTSDISVPGNSNESTNLILLYLYVRESGDANIVIMLSRAQI